MRRKTGSGSRGTDGVRLPQLTKDEAVRIGKRRFKLVQSESITGIYNKTLSRSYDSLGRSSGMNISTEYDVDYGYDTLGRFSTVTNGNDVFTYGYLTNSNLIQSITYPSSITSTKSYETYRDLITSVENKYDTTTVSKYDYTNDDLGRRTAMGKSGTAFTQTDSIAYGYNDKSEVTSAVATNQSTYDYGFSFDPIGNRLTSSSTETGSTVTRNYSNNQINQYTAIDNPTAAPTYDFDGNTTSCELSATNWSFTWDAENRLIAAEKIGQRLEFKYDYLSRRVEKRVLDGETESKKERFVYDNFLQIEKLDALDSNAIENKRIWGAESKIIADIDSSDTAFYALGDANKNISEYIDDSGTIQAHYEFSPFGKVTVASGSSPDNFDFKFSSEYFDAETELVYYNHRYYSPELGRWLSRDPIKEEGGYNLYAMCFNNTINLIDILGFACDCSGAGWLGGQTLDLIGYLWNSPNTLIGMGWGTIGLIGGGSIGFNNNAIEFYNHPGMNGSLGVSGAITFGNTISYMGNQSPNTFGPNYFLTSEGHTVGQHEGSHTIQGEILGPLYLPTHLIGGLISEITSGSWHGNNFMENGPMSNPDATPW